MPRCDKMRKQNLLAWMVPYFETKDRVISNYSYDTILQLSMINYNGELISLQKGEHSSKALGKYLHLLSRQKNRHFDL